jgi:uncharacterized protein (TIGR00251 family)
MPILADYGLTPAPDGCRLAVQVAPRAAANRLLGPYRGALKVALTAPPVEGAANAALLAFLAEVLGVPRSRLTLVAGATRRAKLVHIAGLPPEAVLARLEQGADHA